MDRPEPIGVKDSTKGLLLAPPIVPLVLVVVLELALTRFPWKLLQVRSLEWGGTTSVALLVMEEEGIIGVIVGEAAFPLIAFLGLVGDEDRVGLVLGLCCDKTDLIWAVTCVGGDYMIIHMIKLSWNYLADVDIRCVPRVIPVRRGALTTSNLDLPSLFSFLFPQSRVCDQRKSEINEWENVVDVKEKKRGGKGDVCDLQVPL